MVIAKYDNGNGGSSRGSNSSSTLSDSDNSDEEERMLLDSGEEYEKAKNSTSDIRGEHPFSRFSDFRGL